MATKAKREKKELTDSEREARRLLKGAKFRELAEARVPAAIKRIRMVARLGNRANYQYTEDQARKVIAAVKSEVAALERAFDAGMEPELFTL